VLVDALSLGSVSHHAPLTDAAARDPDQVLVLFDRRAARIRVLDISGHRPQVHVSRGSSWRGPHRGVSPCRPGLRPSVSWSNEQEADGADETAEGSLHRFGITRPLRTEAFDILGPAGRAHASSHVGMLLLRLWGTDVSRRDAAEVDRFRIGPFVVLRVSPGVRIVCPRRNVAAAVALHVVHDHPPARSLMATPLSQRSCRRRCSRFTSI